MKDKKLILCALAGVSILTIGAAVAAGNKAGFKVFANPVQAEWHHYSERMPGINPGIKEYWVQCGGNYQFTEPEGATIINQSGWDTSGFAVDDDRYTYQCTHKIANSAIAGTSANDSQPAPSHGFTDYQGKTFTASGYQGFDVDVSNYDYITFALRHNLGYLCLFGGGSCGSDEQEVAIEKDDNLVMWKDVWYYISLERNAEGKWDAYVGRYNFPKRYEASIKMGDQAKNGNNLKDIVGVWTWDALKAEDMIYSTAVYGAEKSHHYVWDTSKISPVETGTCAVCGEAGGERPAAAVDFTTNKYGAKLINKSASTDVSDWTISSEGPHQGEAFLQAQGTTSISYLCYDWNLMEMSLPRIDFSKYSNVSFDLDNVKWKPADLVGGSNWAIGFTEATMESYASTASETEISGGKLSFTTYANKVVGKISSFGLITEKTFEFTDADIINGRKSVTLYVKTTLNSSSLAVVLSNLSLVEKPEAANITDSSIKEFYTTKQVRRVEQQDAWKAPIAPLNPFRSVPQSIEIMSPSLSTVFWLGTP